MNATMPLSSEVRVESSRPAGRRPGASAKGRNAGSDGFAAVFQAMLAGAMTTVPAQGVVPQAPAPAAIGPEIANSGARPAAQTAGGGESPSLAAPGQGAETLVTGVSVEGQMNAAPASGEAMAPDQAAGAPAAPRAATSEVPAGFPRSEEKKTPTVTTAVDAPLEGAPSRSSAGSAKEVEPSATLKAEGAKKGASPGREKPVWAPGAAQPGEKGGKIEPARPAGKKAQSESKYPGDNGPGPERFQGLSFRETASREAGSPVSFSRVAPESQVDPPQSGRAGEILRQVAEHLKPAVQSGQGEVRIQLHPAELGRVDLRLTVENGSLSARFLVQNGEVRQVLESSLPQLRQSLADQGVRVDLLNVSVAGGGFSFQSGGHQSKEGGNPRSGRPARNPVYAAEAVVPQARALYGGLARGSSSLVDYLA